MNHTVPFIPGEISNGARRAVTFSAWRGNAPVRCEALDHAQSFEEAVNAVLPGSVHKTVLSVLKTDAGKGKQEVRFYYLKLSTKNGHWRAANDGGRKVFVGNLEPELLHSLPVRAFEPEPPFDAFRDNAAGHDLTLVVLNDARRG